MDQGYVLIVTLFIISSLLIMGIFLLDHFLIQTRINHNLYLEMKLFYLAQAGVEYSMFRLKEDHSWRTTGFSINLGVDGNIHLQVSDSETNIKIDSTGEYQEYCHEIEALLTNSPPIQRIK